jgi:ring-1,2-phenylacetyl-CoA epoxidase subunit PaaC
MTPRPAPASDGRLAGQAWPAGDARSAGHAQPAGDAALAAYALRLGDDALILAQRLGEWVASAPELEEDVAMANIALDLLGQARALLSYAGQVEGRGRTEDDLAYFRAEREFSNLQIVELDNGDFGQTTARQLLFTSYQLELYKDLQNSRDETLAGVAAKAVKEVAYHRDHAAQWTLRLGDGTDESHRRMQAGLDRVWPYVAEMFRSDPLEQALAADGISVDSPALFPAWQEYVTGVLSAATLTQPDTWTAPGGGRRGLHTERLGYLLAEMQHLARSHPGAKW